MKAPDLYIVTIVAEDDSTVDSFLIEKEDYEKEIKDKLCDLEIS